jgi:hypothetical protein
MNDQITTKRGLADWFRHLLRKWRPVPIQLNPFRTAIKREPDRPGNYYFFEVFIEITVGGVTYLGYPQQAIRDVGKTPPVIRWFSPPKVSLRDPAIRRVRWIDVPKKGLSGRTLTSPVDLLGAEGLFGDKKYRFEQILHATKYQVVYSLFCDENQSRIAYAFPCELFSAEKASARTLN